ncbi:MAG TPA: VIT domain-containing protein [Planctomycetota bacterium]|nr:VIT domain-containing protein [Planctomycetota bacterium]
MTFTRRQLLVLFTVTLVALAAMPSVKAEALLLPIVDGKFVDLPPPDIDRERRRPRPIPQPHMLPFRMTGSKVDVRIEENIATTSMEQSFLNLSNRDLEVRVMIPLPAGASVNSSALSMNDQMIEGKLYDAGQAQSIYESIVSQRKDPALLRFAGDNLYEARVFPIAPGQERKLRFSYTQVLPQNGGLYDYRHILSGSQMYQSGIEKFDFTCTVKSKDPMGPVYSPSHQVSVQRPDDKTAVIKLSGQNLSSDRDFRLYYSPTTSDVALRLITHRSSENEDGYFMLLGRVDDQLENTKVLPKEIVFCVDVSGSMRGEKIEQARAALKQCLATLNPQDRFNLITFSTEVQGLSSDKLLDATKENIAKANAAVDQIEASGATNIDGALSAALGSDFSEGEAKAKMVVFMTDGLPTIGVTDASSILKNVQTGNAKSKVRIFNFGVGNEVNTHLLDKMSLDYDGVSTYVSPRENIETKVADLTNKIRHPVMTNVALSYGTGSGANSIYPKRIPALYRGGEILMVGRYRTSVSGEIVLTGNVGGETRNISLKVNWPARDLGNSYLPRVWAMRKIGHLLEDIRLRGPNDEIIKEIVELAQRHGIVTPYTSQLVLEPGMDGNNRWRGDPGIIGGGGPAPMPEAAMRRNLDAKKEAADAAFAAGKAAHQAASGEVATALATVERDLKEANGATAEGNFSAAPRPEAAEKRLRFREALAAEGKDKSDEARKAKADAIEQAATEAVKQVGARTFYNRGGIWVDSTLKPDAKPTIVKAFSKEYFDLLKADGDLGPVLALGGKILVAVKDTVYQIEE